MRDGSWGIRSTAALAAGQTVTVTKRDGGTKLETVAHVVWSGNGVWLASLVASRTPARSSQSSAGRHPRTGCSCGSREGITRDSDCRQCQYDAE